TGADCPPGQVCSDGGICKPPPEAECEQDDDCAFGEICDEGLCTLELISCTSPEDCPEGFACTPNGFCKPLPTGACTSDEDCPDPLTCTNGMCTPAVVAACTTDDDCEPDQVCTDGQCVIDLISCSVPEDCPEGFFCTPTGFCKPTPTGVCTSDANCPGDLVCVNGACVVGEPGACESDADCLTGQVCIDGTCHPGGQGSACASDGDCATGYACVCTYPPECPDGSCAPCKDMCVPEAPGEELTACQIDADCGDGMWCDTEGPCLPNPNCTPSEPCTEECWGACVTEPTPAGAPCADHGDCPVGEWCEQDVAAASGNCVEAPPTTCVVTGCSGQLCAPEDMVTTCDEEPWYVCYVDAECGDFSDSGGCQWKHTDAFLECLGELGPDSMP
ncbi:MAG: dickkopf-related protein, partial [Myxococcota bacterium]|nr:dickkopf-related protein [Myxococcota bacterium]